MKIGYGTQTHTQNTKIFWSKLLKKFTKIWFLPKFFRFFKYGFQVPNPTHIFYTCIQKSLCVRKAFIVLYTDSQIRRQNCTGAATPAPTIKKIQRKTAPCGWAGHLLMQRFPGEMTAPGEPTHRGVARPTRSIKGDRLVVDHIDSGQFRPQYSSPQQ